MSTASLTPLANDHGDALVRWVVDCVDVLADSRWGPALGYRGHEVADLCFEEGFLATQRALRGVRTRGARPPWLRTLLGLRSGSIRRGLDELAAHLRSTRPRHTRALFFPVEPTHVQQHLPVARAASQQGIEVQFATTRAALVAPLRGEGLPGLLVQAAWPLRLAAARRAGLAALSVLETSPGVRLPPCPEPLSETDAVDVLREPLLRLLPFAYEAIRAAELMVEELQPSVIMVGNDLTVGGRALCRVATQAGVPTSCLMHGTVMDGLHAEHVADRLLVYGQAQRRYLADHHGIAHDRIEVCGAPYLDKLRPQSGVVNDALRSRLQLAPAQPLVVMAISNPANLVSELQHRRTIEAVTRLTAAVPEAVFVAKLHRGDSAQHYQPLLAQVPGARLHVVAHLTPGWPPDIFDWLQGCSLLLTGASTAAIEAMLLGVPVVSMDFTGDYAAVDFIAHGATVHVGNHAELTRAVRSIVVDGVQPAGAQRAAADFLADYFHGRDGRSADRCARALVQLPDRREPPCAV